MSCGGGHRHGSDLALLWLWHRLAAVAPIGPLAWEPPYAARAALKKKEKNGYSYLNYMCSTDPSPSVYPGQSLPQVDGLL